MSTEHKRIQLNFSQGGIEVQFNLEKEKEAIAISSIQIHGNFETGLPESSELEYNHDANEWELCVYYDKGNGGQASTKIRERINNPYAKEIIEEILRIKEENPVR